jgi:hypothetical protein
MAENKSGSPFTARWHIVSVWGWDYDFTDAHVQGYLDFDAEGRGEFLFGPMHGRMDSERLNLQAQHGFA